MYTWFFCGRHDLTNADALQIKFDAFIDIPDYDDHLQIAVGIGSSILWISEDLSVDSSADFWRTFETVPIYDGVGQQQVWIGFLFISDGDSITSEGVWLDNIEASVYRTPSECGNLDPGDKGLNIDSRDPRNDTVPIIRPGDISVLDDLDSSTTDWVRFVFKPMNGETLIDLEDYDFMVDSLCDRGISVIAVVNEETISHVAYAPESPAYRQAYFDEVAVLAEHFENRITYWEVWNEPDNFIGGTSEPPYTLVFPNAGSLKRPLGIY
ncbi:MAG: hypothetical protein M5U34_14240 [Chloroflexi bacterium]|nr:hypothetical protein [Chloroflexota bacterium]